MKGRRPAWLRALQERASQPPRVARRPLCIDAAPTPVGSIEPALAAALRAAAMPLEQRAQREFVTGAPDAALARIANCLRVHGRCGKWRDELLAVTDESLRRHAAIERAAVRPLGIATFAVHLMGLTPRGEVWVQQRALDKATDPGCWDTLVGGLVAAGESEALALERETWEEAGLRVDRLQRVAKVDRITVRRPVPEGYMVEHIDVFEAVVPDAMQPLNRDGEVARFERMSPDALIDRLAAGAFTLEAGLMLAHHLSRRGLLGA